MSKWFVPSAAWPLTFALLTSVSSARAAVGTDLGYGAKASALGGMTAALARDGFSAFQNPALLSGSGAAPAPALSSAPRIVSRTAPGDLEFSWGIIFLKPQMSKIPGPVVIQNTTTGDAVRTGSVDTNYPSVIGQAIGLNYRNLHSDWKPGLGLTVYLPLDRFAYLDSGEPFAPDYVRYRSRMEKPEFHLALGAEPTPGFRIGAGAQLGAGLNSNVDVFLQTDPAKSSSMRVAASLKTKASPYLGVQVDPVPDWTTGLVLRFALSNPEDISVHASGRVIGDLSAIDVAFRSLATAYYEPLTLEWGNRVQVGTASTVHLQLEYQKWSDYRSPNVGIDTAATTNCAPNCGGLEFASSRYPSFRTRDLLVPKIGWELGDFRLGYSYVGSIFSGLPGDTGADANLLDPAHHRFSTGYGFRGTDFLTTQLPWTIELMVSYTRLRSDAVARSGDAIGAPGYATGGNLFGGGVSLNLSL